MEVYDYQLTGLYADGLFRKMVYGQISLYEFYRVSNLLIGLGIPYDVSFVPGTRKEGAALQLTIHITPSKTEVFVIGLEPGSNAFSPSP